MGKSFLRRCFAAGLLLIAGLTFPGVSSAQEAPRLADERLELTLFAEDPQIVTPIGLAIDGDDRIFVVESHTHHPPADYPGPKSDRIKVFIDADDDGRPERVSIFAQGLRQAMNLTFSPDGDLFVVCAREVLRLADEDGDGVCDRQDQVLELITPERYAHNSLLGITFDRDGWMYVSRGNVASHHYRFQGADQTFVEGYGDGGNVIRCRPDGTKLQEFATGFWNPFDLKFDRNGRLLLVDNDPDARGPNRLVHAVRGGDYGYQSLYGGGGNHPFQGWDGSLPGVLPFVAGVGEAPSGLVDCRRAALPQDYARSVLVTIWNENTIERIDLAAKGASLTAQKKAVWMAGPQDFRPVAMEADSRGNLFITDWVLVDYPNHGRGRIWRVRSKEKSTALKPQAYFAPYLPDPTLAERAALAKTTDPTRLTAALQSDDPFVRHAAHLRLAHPQFAPLRQSLAGDEDARVRLGALLAEKKAGRTSLEPIRRLLADPDAAVRQAALRAAGEAMAPELRPDLEAALVAGPVGAVLFETYLAAVENLDPEFVKAYQSRQTPRAKDLPRRLDPEVLRRVAQDERFSAEVRALAIRRWDDQTVDQHLDWLRERLASPDDVLALAVIRRLAALPEEKRDRLAETLAELALDRGRSSAVRCEALLALSEARVAQPQRFIPLLKDADAEVAVEAARTFRAWLDAGRAAECVELILRMRLADEVQEPLSYALEGKLFEGREPIARPQTNEQWREALAAGGDPGRGRRVFFSARVTCARCHTVDGRGGVLGPDLSRVAQSKTRRQIVEAILDPSAEFPPQYQAWIVVTTDGRIHRGLQLDHLAGGAIALIAETGENVRFRADQIEAYAASPTSLMPAGLSETMSVHEFQDLVAFLASLK